MAADAIRVGLVGVGGISRAHQQGYRELPTAARVVAVCDINVDLAQQVAASFDCTVYTAYTDLLTDPQVEAVDITLPHNLHYEVAKAALASGKHVLVEKPMAATSMECLDLTKTARRAGLTCTVAENTRFVGAYLAAERLLRAGALGEPRLIRTLISGSEVDRLSDTSLWKGRRVGTLGGAVYDAGPHSFYLIKWLFGEIDTLQAFQSRLVPVSEVEDHAVVAGTLKSGALFTTEYTFTAEIPWSERCEIYGSTGSLIIDQLCDPPVIHYQGKLDFTGYPLADVPYNLQGWKIRSIADGVKDFIEAVRDERPTSVDPMDGWYTLKVVEQAYASIAQESRRLKL